MKNLLSIEQLTGDEIKDLLALGHKLKACLLYTSRCV